MRKSINKHENSDVDLNEGENMDDMENNTTVTNVETVPLEPSHQPSELDLEYCAHLVVRAGRFLEMGDIAAAEKCLQQGLERVPEQPACVAYMAVCLAAGKRKFVTAEKLVKNIIRNNPHDPTAWYALGRINLLGGRREQAFRNFEKAKRFSKDDGAIEDSVNQMDPRRDPVLRFLPRNSFLNVVLGRIRSKFCC